MGPPLNESLVDPRYRKSLSQFASRIHVLTGLNDDELGILYKNAFAFAFPSLMEGFGWPPLEAQAHGCPVIASRAGSLDEVLGDSILTIDPSKPQELCEALAQLRAHPKECQRLSENFDRDGASAARVWSSLSRRDRKDPLLIGAYCRRLINVGNMVEAEKLLRKSIGKQWSEDLVQLYGLIRTEHPFEQIEVAEAWAKRHAQNSHVLITLARLYLHAGNRDRSKSLLVEAARYGGGHESFIELGLLLEAAGEGDSALQAYRRGLERLGQTSDGIAPLADRELLPLVSESND